MPVPKFLIDPSGRNIRAGFNKTRIVTTMLYSKRETIHCGITIISTINASGYFTIEKRKTT
jgi:hypothetical protein